MLNRHKDARQTMRAATLALCLAVTACTQFPELDGTVSPDLKDADFPDLVPLEPLLAEAAPVVEDPAETSRALDARIAALRARASALQRGAIVDDSTRSQLDPTLN